MLSSKKWRSSTNGGKTKLMHSPICRAGFLAYLLASACQGAALVADPVPQGTLSSPTDSGSEASDAADTPIPLPTLSPSPQEPAEVNLNQTGLPAVTLAGLSNLLKTSSTYQPMAGNLDPNKRYSLVPPLASEKLYGASRGPVAADVNQTLGNSTLMSLLATLADRLPTTLQSGIRYVASSPDGSNLYAVRLFLPSAQNGDVYMERQVATDDHWLRPPMGGRLGAQGNVLWPAIYEKALVTAKDTQVSDANARGYELMNDLWFLEACRSVLGVAPSDGVEWASNKAPINNPATGAESDSLDLTNTGQRLTFVRSVLPEKMTALTGYDASKQSVALPSGASLRRVPDSQDMVYRYMSGEELRLTAYLWLGVLTATRYQVLLRSPYGHNTDFAADDHGAFWMPRSDLWWTFDGRVSVDVPANLRGSAATPHEPPKL